MNNATPISLLSPVLLLAGCCARDLLWPSRAALGGWARRAPASECPELAAAFELAGEP